ncbi:hypothetical protein Vafri_18180 [Volvox africanus]|nr:hypothetical protein Vafri_18180 [Volvox africanus]
MCSVLGLLSSRHAALAENGPLPSTCGSNDGDEGAVPPGVLSYIDPSGYFRLVRPCGWRIVARLPQGSSVIGSFYNPEEPGAETLAVYRAPAPPGVEETQQLGTARDVATSLAAIAPNGLIVDAKSLEHGGRSYLLAHVQFGGNTAGMFGAVREFRIVTIASGVQYTMRLTTTRYRYLAFPQVRDLANAICESFEVLV